jgi:hypothetical protein
VALQDVELDANSIEIVSISQMVDILHTRITPMSCCGFGRSIKAIASWNSLI